MMWTHVATDVVEDCNALHVVPVVVLGEEVGEQHSDNYGAKE